MEDLTFGDWIELIALTLLGMVLVTALVRMTARRLPEIGEHMSSALFWLFDIGRVDTDNVDRVDDVPYRVVTPKNASKEVLYVVEQAKLDALAVLIVESKRKSFRDGVVPETRGIAALFGFKPSSNPNSDYQKLRQQLHARLAAAAPVKVRFRPLAPPQQAARDRLRLDEDR